MKTCIDCEREKPAAHFYKCKTMKDGLTTNCRVCFNAERRRMGIRQPTAHPAMLEFLGSPKRGLISENGKVYFPAKTLEKTLIEKECTSCFKVKNMEEFHRAKEGRGGRKSVCKVCSIKRDTERRINNRERLSTVGVNVV